MYHTTTALVLREVKYKEADKILTLLTSNMGKVTAKARGALRKGSRCGAASQALCYGEFTMFEHRGKWTVDEASSIESFLPLRGDIEKLALGSYFAELLEAVSDEDSPNSALLRLGLNSLYALSRELYPMEQVKAVFELRLMCLSGYMPDTEGEGELFSVSDGVFHSAAAPGPGKSLPLDPAAKRAMEYIAGAEEKRVFAFRIPPASLRRLGAVCESYVEGQLERRFGTLDYWKRLRA